MKILLLIISLIFFPAEKENSCASIKTGKFTNKTKDTIITRTKEYQTEICKEDGTHWKWKLHWINACQYHMVLKEDYSTNPSNVFVIGDTITIKFITVNKAKYDWEATYKGRSFKGFNYIL